MSISLFETASRKKLRFQSARGPLSVEDLWDLPLTSKNQMNLDTIGKAARKALNEAEEDSLVTPTKKDPLLALRFDIVKYIIGIKVTELDATRKRKEAQTKKRKVQEIIDRKKDAALESMTLEELEAMEKGL